MDQLLCQQRPHVNSTCCSGAHGLGSAPGWLDPSTSGGEEMPTRSNFSPILFSLCGGLPSLFNREHLLPTSDQFQTRPGAFQGNVTCTRPKTHPIQGSFDRRPFGHHLFSSFLCHTYGRLGLFSFIGKIPSLGSKRPNQGMPPASHGQVDPRWRAGALPIRGTPTRPSRHPALPTATAQPATAARGLHHCRKGTP